MIQVILSSKPLQPKDHHFVGIVVDCHWMLQRSFIEMLHGGDRRRWIDSHCRQVQRLDSLHRLGDNVQHGGKGVIQISFGVVVSAPIWLVLLCANKEGKR